MSDPAIECWEIAGHDGDQEWPCATACLVYTTEELESK